MALAAALALGMMPYPLLQRASAYALTGTPAPSDQLGMTHFFMMGQNDTSNGSFLEDDVTYSLSFDTPEERAAANRSRMWERISARGVAGNLRFYTCKAYRSYCDGSLACNYGFPEVEMPRKTDAVSQFFRSIFQTRGQYNQILNTAAQGLWLLLLALCAVACVSHRRHAFCAALGLIQLGMFFYLMLSEAHPRCLFLFAPCFVVLASLALDRPAPSPQKQ